jgi:hypothetical protein
MRTRSPRALLAPALALSAPALALALAACGGDSLTSNGALEATTPGCRADARLSTGALYRICVPDQWNGGLVVFAHGYVRPGDSVAVLDTPLEGVPVSEIVRGLGYAWAGTSYRDNGLIVPQAVDDILALSSEFDRRFGKPTARRLLAGVSEGGLVAELVGERSGQPFDGVLTACSPVGDFRAQLDWFGDFRVVFDYFFPGVLPGTVTAVPDELRADWDKVYVPKVIQALIGNPQAALQLLAVTHAPADLSNPSTVGETVIGLLWYDVFAFPDAAARLGGQPYDNSARVYAGSSDDAKLNASVTRVTADPAALAAIAAKFTTSGALLVPTVNPHTTGDPVVPFEQSRVFQQKVAAAGKTAIYAADSVARYGHCTFTRAELVADFQRLEGLTHPGSSARVAALVPAASARAPAP